MKKTRAGLQTVEQRRRKRTRTPMVITPDSDPTQSDVLATKTALCPSPRMKASTQLIAIPTMKTRRSHSFSRSTLIRFAAPSLLLLFFFLFFFLDAASANRDSTTRGRSSTTSTADTNTTKSSAAVVSAN
jgi:hypothetical protein